MTPRDVINHLPPDLCEDLAIVCLERLTPDRVAAAVRHATTEDELAEVGIAIRKFVTRDSSTD